MRPVFGWIITITAAVIFGLGAALLVGLTTNRNNTQPTSQSWNPYRPWWGSNNPSFGVRPGGMMGPGGMLNPGYGTRNPDETRIPIEEAIEQAKSFTGSQGSDLQVSEVMEFTDNYYAVVIETSSNRGAMELLIDPYTGVATPEPGPNMMWNTQYSPMGRMGWMMGGRVWGDNALSLDQAIQEGQAFLDKNISRAKLETEGTSFYGYYTFDYTVNDNIAGMLSVNGSTGEAWLHTWHGEFIQEIEME